ncbi:MAG: DUF2191 domain-containing protein [Gemmatimonadetes bacterium]|nr:DUF2191 domain-containing protein [Gemmatimonadota bacterium]NNK62037.1 DUF2191 domain-containing protein [Gemmatimonadota bacterium]
MRTTLTLDDDVAIRLEKLQVERSDSFKAVVNAALRAGLDALSAPAEEATPYRITPHPAGGCTLPDLDSLHEALAIGEGEGFR